MLSVAALDPPRPLDPSRRLPRPTSAHDAALASERHQLAREVHDVLAHTLGAASVQLTALNGLLDADGASPHVLEHVSALRRLVSEGLVEARDAVRALREADQPLSARLAGLCDLHSAAALEVRGPDRALTPETTLALYRIAQEALTNAQKHAPGAPIHVLLSFGCSRVRLQVSNERSESASPLACSGGGHGLLGMRERVELVGGSFDAGPTLGGWCVSAELVMPSYGPRSVSALAATEVVR